MANINPHLEKLEANHEDWRKTLLEMYKDGASDREVMTSLRLTQYAWDNLMGSPMDSDFNDIVSLGRILAFAWWEKQGRINLTNPKFQTALWTINMKNRFGWSEKTEQALTNVDLTNKSDSELLEEIKVLNESLRLGRGKGAI